MKIKTIKIFGGLALIIIALGIFFMYYVEKFSPQGHGSKASYTFNVSKNQLEKKIDSLTELNQNISREKLFSGQKDNHYNTDGYFTIIIDSTSFCFRYYGDAKKWDSSLNTSKIFIAFIKNLDSSKKRTSIENLYLVEDKFINKIVNKNTILLKKEINKNYYKNYNRAFPPLQEISLFSPLPKTSI